MHTYKSFHRIHDNLKGFLHYKSVDTDLKL